MYRIVARCKYMVTGGTVSNNQLEKTIACYVSRGYTVERITEVKETTE